MNNSSSRTQLDSYRPESRWLGHHSDGWELIPLLFSWFFLCWASALVHSLGVFASGILVCAGQEEMSTSRGEVWGQASRVEACSTAFTGSLASLLQHEIQAVCNSLVIQREPVVRALCRRKTSETSDSVLCAGCSVSRGGCAVCIRSSSEGCTENSGGFCLCKAQQPGSEKLGGKNLSRATTPRVRLGGIHWDCGGVEGGGVECVISCVVTLLLLLITFMKMTRSCNRSNTKTRQLQRCKVVYHTARVTALLPRWTKTAAGKQRTLALV